VELKQRNSQLPFIGRGSGRSLIVIPLATITTSRRTPFSDYPGVRFHTFVAMDSAAGVIFLFASLRVWRIGVVLHLLALTFTSAAAARFELAHFAVGRSRFTLTFENRFT
jgi:hypothetical protein